MSLRIGDVLAQQLDRHRVGGCRCAVFQLLFQREPHPRLALARRLLMAATCKAHARAWAVGWSITPKMMHLAMAQALSHTGPFRGMPCASPWHVTQ